MYWRPLPIHPIKDDAVTDLPPPEPEPLILAIELLVAGLALAGSRADRLALHHDLRALAAKHPALEAAMRSLIEDRPAFERWRAYNRAEAAAAAWVERQGAAAAKTSASCPGPRPSGSCR
jgi:hypothetical protein